MTDRAADLPVQRRTFPREIWLALALFWSLTAASLGRAVLAYRRLPALGFLPALLPGSFRGDLLGSMGRFHYFGSAEFFSTRWWPWNYPASLALVYRVLYSVPGWTATLYYGILLLTLLSATALFVRACGRRGVAVGPALALSLPILWLSSPTVVMAFLGNIELFVWIALGLGLFAYARGRYAAAAVLFGVAASFKYFPVIFALLFSVKTQRRYIALTLGSSVAATVLASAIQGPTLMGCFRGLSSQTALFTSFYLYDWHGFESSIDHSLYALFRLAMWHTGELSHAPSVLRVYLAVVSLLLLAVYLLRIRTMSVLNRFALLSIAAITFSPLSHEYTMVHLFGPFAAFCLAVTEGRGSGIPRWALGSAAACFAVSLALVTFVQWHNVRLGGQVHLASLCALFLLFLRFDFGRGVGGESTPGALA